MSALDIVARLENAAGWRDTPTDAANVMEDAAEEIIRLRAAGDRLAEAVGRGHAESAALDAWREARR